MRVKLGLFKYNIEPASLNTLVEVERITGQPFYKLSDTPEDMISYFYAMFKAAGFWLPQWAFMVLITEEAIEKINTHLEQLEEAQEVEASHKPEQKKPEKVSANNLLNQLCIISGRPPQEVLKLSEYEREELLDAYAMLNREKWERSRFLAYHIARPNLENPELTLEEFCPLAWEVEAKQQLEPISKERFKQIMEIDLKQNGK